MPNTWSQGNPLIPLYTELERTLRDNRSIVNEGVHNTVALLEGIHSSGEHKDQSI